MKREPILFSDLLLDTKDGEWGEGEEAPGQVLCDVIRGTDFSDLNSPGIDLPKRWIPEHLVERKALQANDILLETAGGTAKQSTGRTALVTAEFLASREGRPVLCSSFARHLRVDRSKVHPVYLYYVLQALYTSGYMGVFNLQHTGVARFQFTAFRTKTKLELHANVEQPQIGATLKAYDDLITNNQRRIALLGSMAEEIYREWFVRMRFPDYSTARFVVGRPFDWKPKRIAALVDRRPYGRLFHERDVLATGTVRVIDQSRLAELGFHSYQPDHVASEDKPILAFGDHSCKLLLMTEPFSVAENVIPFDPAPDVDPYFLYQLLRGQVSTTEYKRHWTELMSKEVLVPPIQLCQAFMKQVKPLYQQMSILQAQIRKLETIRVMLLPRLISGKLRIDHLDIQYPPSMKAELAEAD